MLKRILGLSLLILALNGNSHAIGTFNSSDLPLIKESSDLQKVEIAKLSLSSQATVHVNPDQMQLKIGVVTLSQMAEDALEDNALRMQDVVKALVTAGLPRSDFETGHFAIHPTYTPYPKNPPENWQPSINGYEVSNSITIHTSKLDLAGILIDAANKAGANSVDDIHFSLSDPHDKWNEALTAATANALYDAKTIAHAAGINLGRLLAITLENTHAAVPRANAFFQSKAIAAEATPIMPGDVSLTATVSIVYEIVPIQ